MTWLIIIAAIYATGCTITAIFLWTIGSLWGSNSLGDLAEALLLSLAWPYWLVLMIIGG